MSRPPLKEVLDKRLTGKGQVEYLVIYKGQNNSQCQDTKREPIINLKKELDMLADFEVEYEIKQQKQQQEKVKQQETIRADEEKKKKQKQIEESKALAAMQNEDQESEYEVEEILEKRAIAGGFEYRVKWKGYPASESTWEPSSNIENAVSALEKFKEKERRVLTQIEEEKKIKKIKLSGTEKPLTAGKESNEYNKILDNMSKNVSNLKSQKEDELELELEDEMPNEKGHFDTDTPDKVIAARPEKDKLMLTIHWKPRKNGHIPQDSIFSNKEIFKYNARFLADYYESKLKFIPLPQKSQPTVEQQKKSILIDESND